jgi:hypothetical protein
MPKQLALLDRKRRRLLTQLAEALGPPFGRLRRVGIAFVLVGHYLAATDRTHI